MNRYCPGFETNLAFCGRQEISISEYNPLYHPAITCVHGHELVYVCPQDYRAHFRHKNVSDCAGMNAMSQWHKDWQARFAIQEVSFAKIGQMIKSRRADVYIAPHNLVVEFQHSYIEPAEVINRANDYATHGKRLIWVVDGANDITVTAAPYGRKFLEFTNNIWKYNSFQNICGDNYGRSYDLNTHNYIYIDIEGLLYRVHPQYVKSHMIDVNPPISIHEFMGILHRGEIGNHNMTNKGVTCIPPQATLTVVQQGAGNGKTFGIMQKLMSAEFAHYDYFIMVTKMHSAKYVMYREFIDQLAGGKLPQLSKMHYPSDEVDKKYVVHFNNNNVVSDDNLHAEMSKTIIFSTIDSLMYTLGDRSASGIDKFAAIVASVARADYELRNSIQYKHNRPVNIPFNKRVCLVCDEIQDLRAEYGAAIIKIMRDKYIDAYVVGDKLQSIQHGDNAFAYLSSGNFGDEIYCAATPKINMCRRFTNPILIDFVNEMINFHKYDLPPIQTQDTKGILSAPNITAPADNPLRVFKRASKKMFDGVERCDIDQIMAYYEAEVNEHHRVPNDFLFVTAFTSHNDLMDALEAEINVFWQNRLKDNEKFTKYAVFHKSEEGSSIDLSESDQATRMVSIHSSKGDGRNVVFLIGLTESALRKFGADETAENKQLVYDSLLHVALTRMKQRLYIRVNCNGDDLCKRLQKYGDFTLGHDKITNVISIKQLISRISNAECAALRPLFDSIQINTSANAIIDMRHHAIRYSSMFVNFLLTAQPIGTKRQIAAVMHHIAGAQIRRCDAKEFYSNANVNFRTARDDVTTHMSNGIDSRKSQEPQVIKLLQIEQTARHTDYAKYLNAIHETSLRIQSKIRDWIKRASFDASTLCPYENVVFHYMYSYARYNSKNRDITMMDLYNITDKYSKFYLKPDEHANCYCRYFNNCGEFDVKEYPLKEHYDLMAGFTTRVTDYLRSKDLDILTLHPVDVGIESMYTIRTKFMFIAYNADSVYMFYLKPQFTEMNKCQIVWESLFDALLIMLQSKPLAMADKSGQSPQPNWARFGGRKIIAVIVSATELREHSWSDCLKNSRNSFIDKIARLMKQKYKNDADHIVEYYTSRAASHENPMLIRFEYEASYDNSAKKKIPVFVEQAFDDFVERGGVSIAQCRQILSDKIDKHIDKFAIYLKSL